MEEKTEIEFTKKECYIYSFIGIMIITTIELALFNAFGQMNIYINISMIIFGIIYSLGMGWYANKAEELRAH